MQRVEARRELDEKVEQGLRYGLIGIALAGLYAAIYWCGATLIAMPAQLANGAGFAAALVAGYVLHSRWSFRGYGSRSNWSWGRFLVVNFAGYLLNCLWVWLIVDQWAYPVALSIVLLVLVGIFGVAYGLAIGHGRIFFPPGKEGRAATLLNFFNFIGAAAMQVATGAVIEYAVAAGFPQAEAYGWMFGSIALLLALSLVPYLKSKTTAV